MRPFSIVLQPLVVNAARATLKACVFSTSLASALRGGYNIRGLRSILTDSSSCILKWLHRLVTNPGSSVRRLIWCSEVHVNWCMGQDPKRVKPKFLYGLRGNECTGELRGNEFGENYGGTTYRSAIDKSPIKNHNLDK